MRYETDAGGHGEVGGFSSAAAARAAAEQFRAWRGVVGHRWALDAVGSIPVGADSGAALIMREWALLWLGSLDVAPTTMAQYRSLVTRHIVPRFGSLRLEAISGLDARMWALSLRDRYADATVDTIMKLLSMLLADAVRERLIPANPIFPARRGRRPVRVRQEIVWADPEQVLRVGLRACELVDG